MTRFRALTTAVLIAACHHRPAPGAAIVWQWSAPRPAYVGMPAADGDDVAATYGHSVLVMLDATTGAERWRASRVGLRDVAPALTFERVLAATDDGVIAFARGDGRLLWEKSLGDRPSTPAVAGDAVIVTTWDGRLVNVDHWSIDLPGPALGPPAIAGGIVVASWEGGVLAADVASGRVRWRHEFDVGRTSAPAVGQGLAVVVGGDHRAHAYDLASGRERWVRSMRAAGIPRSAPSHSGRPRRGGRPARTCGRVRGGVGAPALERRRPGRGRARRSGLR